MLSQQDQDVARVRMDAAKSALIYFKHYKVLSPNRPLQWIFPAKNRETAWKTVKNNRNAYSITSSAAQTYVNVARTGVGNCEEKASVCYFTLSANPRLSGAQHHVQLVGTVGWDHAFAIVSDNPIVPKTKVDCSDLGYLTVVVDGWVEDWHFPNMSTGDAMRYGFTSVSMGPDRHRCRFMIKRKKIALLQDYLTKIIPVGGVRMS